MKLSTHIPWVPLRSVRPVQIEVYGIGPIFSDCLSDLGGSTSVIIEHLVPLVRAGGHAFPLAKGFSSNSCKFFSVLCSFMYLSLPYLVDQISAWWRSLGAHSREGKRIRAGGRSEVRPPPGPAP
jgi:hypothetical protein